MVMKPVDLELIPAVRVCDFGLKPGLMPLLFNVQSVEKLATIDIFYRHVNLSSD
jgi:hypothetical protein